MVADGSAAVNLDGTITIADDYDYYELVDVKLQEYQEYFSVERNERTVNLEVLKELPESVLNGGTIILTIVASVEENSNLVGYAVVVISLPESDEPTTDGNKLHLYSYRDINTIAFYNFSCPNFHRVSLQWYLQHHR